MRKFSLILFILSFSTFAQVPRLLTGFLSPKSTKSLNKVLEEDARLPSRLINDSAFIQKIKELNPEIKDFSAIGAHQRIYIELPYGTKLVSPSRPVKRIKTGFVKSMKQNDLVSVLKDDALLPEDLLNDSDFIELTKSINPTIGDFSKIPLNQKIYLEIPFDTELVPQTKFEETEPFNITEMEYKPSHRQRKAKGQKKWSLSAFYTASQGIFNEKVDDNEVESTQDSPITLGASALFGMNYDTFYTGSFYLSKLDSGVIENTETFEFPLEYGATTYLNWQKDWPVTPYAGLDYERFSTLNIEEVQNGADPDPIEHDFVFATVGLGKTFKLMDKTILFKSSISHTVWANSDGTDETYSGTKYMVFMAAKLYRNWSTHFLLKQHFLSGATDLTITRLGMGIGYTFF